MLEGAKCFLKCRKQLYIEINHGNIKSCDFVDFFFVKAFENSIACQIVSPRHRMCNAFLRTRLLFDTR